MSQERNPASGDDADRCGEAKRKLNPKTQVPKTGTWGTLRVFWFVIETKVDSFDSKTGELKRVNRYLGHPPLVATKSSTTLPCQIRNHINFLADCGVQVNRKQRAARPCKNQNCKRRTPKSF